MVSCSRHVPLGGDSEEDPGGKHQGSPTEDLPQMAAEGEVQASLLGLQPQQPDLGQMEDNCWLVIWTDDWTENKINMMS